MHGPISWEGWCVSAIWAIAFLGAMTIPPQLVSDDRTAVLASIAFCFVFTAAFYYVAAQHTEPG